MHTGLARSVDDDVRRLARREADLKSKPARKSRSIDKRLLTDGARVEDAEDVSAALDLLEEFKPAIVVSDIAMSPRDGFDLIREIRSRGYDPNGCRHWP